MNDKNSLSWMENIGEMALYVKAKVSTAYAVLGLKSNADFDALFRSANYPLHLIFSNIGAKLNRLR